jgi:hypothetical protein
MILRSTLVLVIALCALQWAQAAESYNYEILYNQKRVGYGSISFERDSSKTFVNYRMSFLVRVLGVPVYKLDSHQLAVFDNEGKLITAKTRADKYFNDYEVTIEPKGDAVEVVSKDGKKELKYSDFALTTLNPTFAPPQPGKWLDLTDGTLVDYRVTRDTDHFALVRPDGKDHLYLDDKNFLQQITSSISTGSITVRRASDEQIVKQAAALPDLLDVASFRSAVTKSG